MASSVIETQNAINIVPQIDENKGLDFRYKGLMPLRQIRKQSRKRGTITYQLVELPRSRKILLLKRLETFKSINSKTFHNLYAFAFSLSHTTGSQCAVEISEESQVLVKALYINYQKRVKLQVTRKLA